MEGLKENHSPQGYKRTTMLHCEALKEILLDMQSNRREYSAYRENWKLEIATEKVPHTLCTCFLCFPAPGPEKGDGAAPEL